MKKLEQIFINHPIKFFIVIYFLVGIGYSFYGFFSEDAFKNEPIAKRIIYSILIIPTWPLATDASDSVPDDLYDY